MNDRRIILVGKSGNGKSYTGNSILHDNAYRSEGGFVGVTKKCEVQEASRAHIRYRVCDTPGLLEADTKLGDRVLEIQESVIKCDKPHAFLLVFSCSNRLTKDEDFTIDLLRIMFGEDIFKHCIVVFTKGGEIANDGKFEELLAKSRVLSDLIENCDNRVVRIENSERNGLQQLLDLIEKVSSNGKKYYKYKLFDGHREGLKNHCKKYDGEEDTADQVSKMRKCINDAVSHIKMKKILKAGVALVGPIAIGALIGHHYWLHPSFK